MYLSLSNSTVEVMTSLGMKKFCFFPKWNRVLIQDYSWNYSIFWAFLSQNPHGVNHKLRIEELGVFQIPHFCLAWCLGATMSLPGFSSVRFVLLHLVPAYVMHTFVFSGSLILGFCYSFVEIVNSIPFLVKILWSFSWLHTRFIELIILKLRFLFQLKFRSHFT